MSEIDLIPGDYRRRRQLRKRLSVFGLAYGALVLCLVVAVAGMTLRARSQARENDKLQAVQKMTHNQTGRLKELRKEKSGLERQLAALRALQGGAPARDLFVAVDRALDGTVWFRDWEFRRAGEVVEREPENARVGYLVVVPSEKRGERDETWLMQTHMTIHAQALDHSSLASFVSRLLDQPEIVEARILKTSIRRYTGAEVVDFELAVLVGAST